MPAHLLHLYFPIMNTSCHLSLQIDNLWLRYKTNQKLCEGKKDTSIKLLLIKETKFHSGWKDQHFFRKAVISF